VKPEKEFKLYQDLYRDDPLRADIFLALVLFHRGISNAIIREDFLIQHQFVGKISDRAFREFYSEIGAAYINMNGKHGIYWPCEPEDLDPIEDLRKKALSMLSRVKNIKQKHEELVRQEQMDLFERRVV